MTRAKRIQEFTNISNKHSVLIRVTCMFLFLLQRKGVITLKCDENKYPGYFSEFTEKEFSSTLQYVSKL